MKNFTNNFKQFTSRLSARWLIMALMLLVGTSSAWAAEITSDGTARLYFNIKGVSWWIAGNNGDGNFAYFFNNSTGKNAWSAHSIKYSGDTYYVVIPNGKWAGVILTRNNTSTSPSWDNRWNQTGDITLSSTSNYISKFSEGSTSVTWGTAIKPASTASLTANPATVNVGIESTLTANLSSNTGINTKSIVSYSVSPNTATVSSDKFKATAEGTYTVTATVTYHPNGYSSLTSTTTASATITVENPCTPPAKPTLDPNSTTVCSGTPFTLPGNHRWYTVAEGGTKLASNTISAGVTQETIYYAEAGEDGCVSTTRTAYTVNVDAKPAITLASPSSICTGTEIDLTEDYVESKTGTVTWYSDANRSQVITNGIVTPINTGTSQTTNTYYAKVTNGVCSAKTDVSLSIKVDPQSAITLKAPPTICQGTTITFANYVNTHTGTVTWHTGPNCTSAAITTAKPDQTTTYYAKATSGNCTPAKASLKVTVNNKPAVPTLSANKTSLIGDEEAVFTVGNTVAGLTYTLYNDEDAGESQTSTGSDLTFEAGEAGSYTVRVTNSCGTSISTPPVVVTVCTPRTNEFRHANSSYAQLPEQPTYYPGDKAYFVSTINCCLTGDWSANLQTGEEAWYTDLTGGTPRFYMTLTRAGNFTITNMANNGCTQANNVLVNLDFTVTALSQVTNANGTASGADIELTWNKSANHSTVMVVRYPISGTETIPAGGQAYTAGNSLGDGTVVYVGTAESYTDQNLPAGVSYKYYFYTVNNNYYSDGVMLNMSSCPIPEEPELTSTAVTACDGVCTAVGYVIIGNMDDYTTDDTYTFQLGSNPVTPDANGKIEINSIANTQYTVTVTNSCGNPNSATVDIAINENKPTITGNNSFQPGGSTTLTSDKGETTTWVALDGGDITSSTTGTSIVFTAEENGTYPVQATYNGCSTTVEIKVQDDLYVWVRRPIKKETAYDQFYHEDQNSEQGGDLFYKEFASLPGDYKQYNQGGKAAEQTCTDKDGYTWYGFVVSKEAIENNYYFTVHAPNDGGEQGDAAKYNGFYTHTYATQLVDMDADLYFVMDETPSNVSRGWNINTPVVVRASGDASFNGNNFADFVPLYVKDANICGKEVVSFEWQKSASQNGTYSTYKSGKGINNIRTREAGWYRCVVTYGDGKGTATSNAIQVTNTTSGTPGTLADFSSKLPVIMVNTNGVGFPSDKNLATKNTNCGSGKRYPSLYADDLKEKVTVDVIIKKGNEIIYDRKARMNYRGSSSLNFKKKSYAFCSGQDSCVFDKGRHDYVKTKKEKMLNILGLNYEASDKDWVLYAATPDPSMMRNRLVFDLYQQMRKDDWGVHSTYVELIVDGEYRGVYIFMDKITANKDRVNITNENGFIVKFDKTDVADRVENKEGDQKTFATSRTGTPNSSNGIESYGACIDQRFEIEYPEKEDIALWDAFYEKVQKRFEDFETALYNKQYDRVRELIDYDSWADWFIISEFIKNQDGFRASNFFIYDGDKIIAMPLWDQELSMDNRTRIAHGSNVKDGLLNTTNSVYTDAFPATFWFTGHKGPNITGGLLNDPCFVSLVKQKWAAYQADQLSAENISEMVAQYHNELDDAIRKRESDKWPYTEAARGKTTDGDYMGYYAEGDPDHYSYNASKNAIISYATARSTDLEANSGMGKAINGLKGEALIFMISPSEVETTPWQSVQITVSAPEGYDYTLNTDELEADNAVIKENGDAYGIKIPRPNDWATGGNGTAKSKVYNVTATIEVSGDNACGTAIANTAQSTITLSDVTENCNPEIVKP